MPDSEPSELARRLGDEMKKQHYYIDISSGPEDDAEWHWLAASILDILKSLGVKVNDAS